MVSENGIAHAAKRARDGDKESLSQLVEILRGPLFAIAYGELRHYEDAQDAVAATLLRVCQHVHELKNTNRIRAWVSQIARNEARRIRQSRMAATLGADYELLAERTVDATQSFPLRLDIENALRRLPRDQAQALFLFYFASLSISEIARRVNRPKGTIKYWLHQGRQHLAQELKGYKLVNTPETPLTGTIISTDIPPEQLNQMSGALRSAGWETVHYLSDFAAAGALENLGTPEKPAYRLNAAQLRASQCIVLDEWIGGRSAFELLPLLRTSAPSTSLFLLVDSVDKNPAFDTTVWAAYMSGVDMLLSKPLQMEEFESFCRRIRTTQQESKI